VQGDRVLVVTQEPVEDEWRGNGHIADPNQHCAVPHPTFYASEMTGTLVLLRHGESVWNRENRFTGWHDVDLTDKGRSEAVEAGRTMLGEGLRFDIAHTSLQTRAVQTGHLALEAMEQVWLPVIRNWRLNERHYGALQGLDKKATTDKYGAGQVKLWRRSYDVPPPPVELSSLEHPINDKRYRLLPPDVLPSTECLADVVVRVLPYWYDVIVPQLLNGLDVLVTAHGNSLRALVMHLQGISRDDIAELNIPTGAPIRYTFDDAARVVSSGYLGDLDAVAAAAAKVAAQAGA
jgi:2,3-bisphosphoglycerate-dependent phosphoglycerate mutase